MINIVYPLIKSDWSEILYSLRSLDTYFRESEYKVHIMGDYKPEWLQNAVFHKMERKPLRHADTGQKLKLCSELFEDFIWVNDDLYFLKPVTLAYIKVSRAQGEYKPGVHKGANEWTQMMTRTYNALKEKYPTRTLYNFITHTPRYFISEKLKKCGEIFPEIYTGELSAVTVYGNLTYSRAPEIVDNTCYSQDGLVKQHHHYLNHNDHTLTDKVKRYVSSRFSIPCKFEIQQDTTSIEWPELKENECFIQYLGKKDNFSIHGYKFRNNLSIMPKTVAAKLIAENPKTFCLE